MSTFTPASTDQSVANPDVRRSNLGLALRHLRDNGSRSRAALASDLGMTRSTASTLVTELIERGLVTDGQLVQSSVGRPSTTVELDGRGVCGIEERSTSTTCPRWRWTCAVKWSRNASSHSTPGRSTPIVFFPLGRPGPGNRGGARAARRHDGRPDRGCCRAVRPDARCADPRPDLGWYDVPVGSILRRDLGAAYPIVVDNEGDLAAAAEVTPGDPGRQEILVLHGEIGVGGGIVTGGRLLRGSHGYAGEFGHMIVEPRGRQCGCGRQGCSETVSGLRALLEKAADPDDAIRNPSMDIDDRLAELNRRAGLNDARTLDALDEVGAWVGIGAAILANALNPATIVLTGYYAAVGHHMRPAIERELRAGVLAPDSGGTRVELSTLGFSAAVRGGATASLESVFADPTRVARRSASGAIA